MVNRTRAPFFLVTTDSGHQGFQSGAWHWLTWRHDHDSMHTAIKVKAEEIGAKGYDSGQASHEIAGSVVYGSPTAFDRETR